MRKYRLTLPSLDGRDRGPFLDGPVVPLGAVPGDSTDPCCSLCGGTINVYIAFKDPDGFKKLQWKPFMAKVITVPKQFDEKYD